MEAVVTIKINAREFDLIREAMKVRVDELIEIGDDPSNHPQVRRDAKKDAVQLGDILRKVR